MTAILYSFRRCPYAMRARLALVLAEQQVGLREVVLRDKPAHMIEVSPKATVPVLIAGDQVIDESLDVMLWALGQNDPHGLLDMPDEGHALIAQNDGPFKAALDRTKYGTRYPDCDPMEERAKAKAILMTLEPRLAGGWLFGDAPKLADYAILPFIRQFANSDRAWFDAQDWPHLRAWLDHFLDSALFDGIMRKYPKWEDGTPEVPFP
ncbi:glutathione S-transferase [Nereida sp. MMG025]|uniref:glutathione S-transferase n=1 Tax=Nereida sp. MMG025 TaxID=2909981 RepID=UPI001F3220B4|nr:glutathione S-transferase [Nereida sp. MMG025]MCF6444507.1 glutathione S-transferase [Nereida sp. MMG025]